MMTGGQQDQSACAFNQRALDYRLRVRRRRLRPVLLQQQLHFAASGRLVPLDAFSSGLGASIEAADPSPRLMSVPKSLYGVSSTTAQ
jgi:hypothetical protein